MTDFPLLSILTFVPLVGAVLILAFIRDSDPEVEARNARFIQQTRQLARNYLDNIS